MSFCFLPLPVWPWSTGAGTRLVFVRMRLIWFLFSPASHCEIIPTVASEPRSLSLASALLRGNVKSYLLFLFSIIKNKSKNVEGK